MHGEDLYQAFYHHPTIGIAQLDLDGRIVEANPALESILGCVGDELRGALFSEFSSGEGADDEDPFSKLIAGGESHYEVEKQYVRPAGGTVWGRLNVSLVREQDGTPQYALAIFQDVTRRRQVEDELREERANIERLWSEASSGIAIVDRRGRVLRIFPGFTRMFGYTKDEAVGQTLQDLVAPDDRREESLSNLRQALAGRTIDMEAVRRRKDGTLIDVSVLGRSLKLGGGRTGVFVLFQDISERKRAEAALERLAATDELTGLLNRRGFNSRGHEELERARRSDARLILFYIDIDNFKQFNDTYGHDEGDRVLAKVAHILRDSCRGSDIVARLGGDEFVILAVDGTGEGERLISARINRALRTLNQSGEHAAPIQLTVGSAVRPPGAEGDLQSLLIEADRRMYEAKANATDRREQVGPPEEQGPGDR